MDHRKPIEPNPPRWQPKDNPDTIEVPGLDTTAPVNDQIDQIEQLITIKLQNIDENMAKIHNILSTRILPAVKRYAVGTQPVREAAKFWTSFYEQAAQIRIPTYDDYSTINEQPSERTETTDAETTAQTLHQDRTVQEKIVEGRSLEREEPSFAPSQAAFSSTPATERVGIVESFHTHNSEQSSWSSSMESPLDRLDRELQNLDDVVGREVFMPPEAIPVPESPTRSSRKGKGKDQPLLRTILKPTGGDPSDPSFRKSPVKPKGILKTPVPKKLNPYLPPNTEPESWNGIVDLKDPSISTPQSRRRMVAQTVRKTPARPPPGDESDDSWEGNLPPGMSPPVLVSPARPPRSLAELGLLKLGQTPSKEAAARITRDLVNDAQKSAQRSVTRRLFGYPDSAVESTLSSMSSPPSLSRYNRGPFGSNSTSLDSAVDQLVFHPAAQHSHQPSQEETVTEGFFASAPFQFQNNYDDDDSDDDDDGNNFQGPAEFFASVRGSAAADDDDDSFDSMDSEDIGDDLEGIPAHPLANRLQRAGFGGGFDDDDSFDDPPGEETDTLFGPRANEPQGHGGLQIHNNLIFPDHTGTTGHLVDSPTPANLVRK